MVISIPLFFLFNWQSVYTLNKYSRNKSVYFISKSLHCFINNNNNKNANLTNNFNKFKELNPSKKYFDKDYPLVFQANYKNKLGKYFEKFNAPLNIVILIVEGLNDDFIYEYMGASLMPFLITLG